MTTPATKLEKARHRIQRLGTIVLPRDTDEPWNGYDADDTELVDARWKTAADKARGQAVVLRKMADALEEAEIPITDVTINLGIVGYRLHSEDIEAKRRFARAGAALFDAFISTGFPRTKRAKLNDEDYWGLESDLGDGISMKFDVSSQATCTFVPVLDENGAPILEEKEVYVGATVTQQVVKTEKTCVSLFDGSVTS